jgi:hypothetical protein
VPKFAPVSAEPDHDPCLGCQRLETGENLVQLSGRNEGRTVCTWCPAWRLECHERHALVLRILDMPTREARRNTVEDTRRHFGDLAADRLHAEVLAEHGRRKAQRGAAE